MVSGMGILQVDGVLIDATAASDDVANFYGLGKYSDGSDTDIQDNRGSLNPLKGDYVFAHSIKQKYGFSVAELRRLLGL